MFDRSSKVGRFEVRQLLGRSRAAELYVAADASDAERLVLLQVARIPSADARRTWLQEAARLRDFRHEGIGEVVEFGEVDDFAFVAFRHSAGHTLAALIAEGHTSEWPVEEKIALVAEACRNPSAARQSGVTHLSITPGTLWVADASHALSIVSLNVPAIHASAESARSNDAENEVDERAYIAPECLDGRARDEVADVYAMAAVLSALLAGDRDRRATTRDVDRILERGLTIRPEERYQTLAAFADALTAVLVERRARSEISVPEPTKTPANGAPESPLVLDENVQFTVYRPTALEPGVWQTLLAFAHLAERRSDAAPDEPEPTAEVARQAAALLGDLSTYREHTEDSLQAVPREGELTFVPFAEGVTFNPPRRSFLWTESVHREEFRLRAQPGLTGRTVHGHLTVYLGAIVIADIGMSFKMSTGTADAAHRVGQSARPYRKIFASYSHRDRAVVQEYSRYAKALGDRYLQDVIDLRSGERWEPGLEDLIREADVFQLFWSWNALESEYVQQECRFALGLARPAFVRPVYWDEPLPSRGNLPPETLRELHFERIWSSAASNRAPAAPSIEEPSKAIRPPAISMPDTASIPPQAPRSPVPAPAPASRLRNWTTGLSLAAVALLAIMIPAVYMSTRLAQPSATSASRRHEDGPVTGGGATPPTTAAGTPRGSGVTSIARGTTPTAAASGRKVTVALHPPATAASGRGAAGVEVSLRDFVTGRVVATAIADADGKAHFNDVAPGRYRVVVDAPDFQAEASSVVVRRERSEAIVDLPVRRRSDRGRGR